ncbi:MAG: restriction endonuclease [Actinomycetota bacterium]
MITLAGAACLWAAVLLSSRYKVPYVVSLTLSGLVFIGLVAGRAWWPGRRLRALRLAQVDEMSGRDFEAYLAAVLAGRGYEVTATAATGDLGVDLIARSSGNALAIQVKRSSRPVSRRAVSDAVAGAEHYGCTGSMVVTNFYFTPGAQVLAASTGCALVDRDELAQWIRRFARQGHQAFSSSMRSSGMSKLE